MGGSSSRQSSSTRGASRGQTFPYAASSGGGPGAIPLPFRDSWSEDSPSGTTTASSSPRSAYDVYRASVQTSTRHVATSSASGHAIPSTNVPKSSSTVDASTSKVQGNSLGLQPTSATNGPTTATGQVLPTSFSTSQARQTSLLGASTPIASQGAVSGNVVQKSTPASAAVQSMPRVATSSLPGPIQSNQHYPTSSASGPAIPVPKSVSTADASTSIVQGQSLGLKQTSTTNGPTAVTRPVLPATSSTSQGQTSSPGASMQMASQMAVGGNVVQKGMSASSASVVQSPQHVASSALPGPPVIATVTSLGAGTTGIAISSLRGGTASLRPRTIMAASAKSPAPIDVGDSFAPFDPHSFDSPVAKKVTRQQEPTVLEKQPVLDEPSVSAAKMTDEDLVIALAVKFSRIVASGESPAMPVRHLSNSIGIDVSELERICEDHPALFECKEGNMKCSVFITETIYRITGQGRGQGRGRGRGARGLSRGRVIGHRDIPDHFTESHVDERLKICYSYNGGSCRDHGVCERLHVCCKWLYGTCGSVHCLYEHTILNNSRNYLKLASFGVVQWKDDNLKRLFLAFEHRLAQVCKHYSSPNGCRNGLNCKDFHICTNFVNGDKLCEVPCHLNHKVHMCENDQNLRKQAGSKRFDHADQLVTRLRLTLGEVPKVSSIKGCYEHNRVALPSSKPDYRNGSAGQGTKVAVWKFLDKDKSWKIQGLSVARVSFGLHVSFILEEAYQAKELDQLVLKIGIHSYKYSQARMEQRNLKTGVARQLKRELVEARRSLPPGWMPMAYASSEDGSVLFPLEKASAEFKKVQERFDEDGGVPGSTILEIYRVQNPYLKKGFSDKKAELIRVYKLNGGPVVEEKLLFHGTKGDVVKHICEQNFDWRRSGEATGTVYGQGAYFALNSSYSHSYTSTVDDGTRLMFVASVLVGTKIRGTSSMRYPPEWKGTIQFDTTVDDVATPTIFVKYDKTEYHPGYIVQYHAEGSRYPRSD